MAAKENSGNGGSHGVAVTEANSGGDSGDAFDLVYITGASSVSYVGEEDFYSFQVQSGADSDWAACMWNVPNNTAPVCAGRMEVRLDTLPASDWITLAFLGVNGNGPVLWVNGSGQLAISDTIVLDVTAPNTVPVGTWFRVEWEIDTTNPGGYYNVLLYPDRESTTSIATLGASRTWLHPGPTNQVFFGQSVNQSAGEGYRFAHPQINDAVPPGPYTGPGLGPGGFQPSINDNFAEALPVNLADDGDTYVSPPLEAMGNTVESGEASGHNSAWWVYKPTNSGEVTADTLASAAHGDPDTIVELYADTGGGIPGLVLVASNDEYGGVSQSLLTGTVDAGTTYYIRVAFWGFYDDGQSRKFVLTLTGPAADSGEEPDLDGMRIIAPAAPVDVDTPAPDVTNLPIDLAAPAATAGVSRPLPVGLTGFPSAAGILWRNNANGGVVGETVTVQNSEISGDPFQEVTAFGANNGPYYARAQPGDTVGFQLVPNADNTLKWVFDGYDPTPQIGGRVYLYLPTGAVSVYLARVERANGGSVRIAWSKAENRLYLDDYQDATTAESLYTSAVLPLGQWHRVDFAFDFNAPIGSYTIRWFTDPESTTPAYTLSGSRFWSGTGAGTYAGATEVRFGPGASVPVVLDNLQINGAGALPGPVGTPDESQTAPAATVGVVAESPEVSGLAAGDPVVVDAPAALVDADARVPTVLGMEPVIAAPPALVQAAAPAPTVFYATGVIAPVATAVSATLSASLINATVTLISPSLDLIVPSRTPRFTVSVSTSDTRTTVEVQYADNPQFNNPTTLTESVNYGGTITYVTLTGETGSLLDGAYYFWRARVVNAFDATSWTIGGRQFFVSVLDGDALAGGTWKVDPAQTPEPHLWWTVPERGTPGDSAVAVGTGFPTSNVVVSLLGERNPATRYSVQATANAYTDVRVIDRDNDRIDCQHNRANFEVPNVPAPGGPLYLEGD